MAESRELISAIDELEALLGQSAAIPDASSVEVVSKHLFSGAG